MDKLEGNEIKIGQYGKFKNTFIGRVEYRCGHLSEYDTDDGFFCKEDGKPYHEFTPLEIEGIINKSRLKELSL